MHVARTGRGVILAAALFCTAAVKQTSIHQAKHSITKKIGRTLQMSSKPNLTYEACVGPIEHSVTEDVSKYYGETLKSSDDLKTNACCTGETVPPRIRKLLSNIHDEVMMKYYGCGLVIPEDLRGKTIVDLGCGAGRDVYTLAQLVGQTGKVIGVDMTEAQLEVARRTTSWHMEKFGFSTPNVEFIQTEIEHLEAIADNSVDIIVSNCVVNLSNNKKAVLEHAYRILKPGGEMYFSDVYASKRVPISARYDPEMYGECLSGALYWGDFLRLARECGFTDPRLAKDERITIHNPRIQELLASIEFFSATYRLFKVNDLEPEAQDYGQAAIYEGTMPECAAQFALDDRFTFPAGVVVPVCGNTFKILQGSRFAPHFRLLGDFTRHNGVYSRAGAKTTSGIPFQSAGKPASASGSSCCAPPASSGASSSCCAPPAAPSVASSSSGCKPGSGCC